MTFGRCFGRHVTAQAQVRHLETRSAGVAFLEGAEDWKDWESGNNDLNLIRVPCCLLFLDAKWDVCSS